MFDFIKKLYEQRLSKITVILLDDSRPGEDESYQFRPGRFFSFLGLMSFMLAVIVALLFMLTPLGGLLYSSEDREMREQVEMITERVISLQDSLNRRDYQLGEMKRVIRLSLDTTLTMDERFSSMFDEVYDNSDFMSVQFNPQSTSERVGTTGILMSNVFKTAPEFPSNYPVEGTLTRDYEPEEFHFGMDLATKMDAEITSIADGTVVNASWTINDGYVITIQHAGGMLSQYKHCSSLTKKNGDVVLKGDIIGTVGDVGVSSTGPHLHFEIWKDGLPQDPAIYLIQ